MPILLDEVQSLLSTLFQRRPALKRRVLAEITNTLTNTAARKLQSIAYYDGKLENDFVEMLTKYVKRNPASEGALLNICDHTAQVAYIIIETMNTKTVYNSGIVCGHGEEFFSFDTIRNKIITKLSEES